ncbi:MULTISPECIES: hypothetical protein [Enterobacteriaceae]|jgi:hypothetical protein|uniref:hypothetical protein n=1 Tax=Enterobacteriaceae TaxID=543 RepID=UPI000B7E5289|nr:MULTISPECIES: hypothetical protein [Enterobacteriaceae]EEW1758366.1 hypothetical protein [Escherichia coli]EFA5213814.1 hypothetical protein [Escherichia coli]EFW2917786.1 hypothetical protein [Shigella sonnei]EFX5182886.1 hypothetical protein [Shigella sonnei]EFY1103045.1 hypothetical protein [Shigella sonnei]
MNSQTKGLSTGKATLSTGGWGAILSVLVSAILTDPNSVWRTVAYALVPGVAATLTYVMNWFISRHGFESPEDAAKRAKCKRDLAEIEKQLRSDHLSPEIKSTLMQAKARTIEILVSIGRESILETSARNITPSKTADPQS